jgi:membrane protein required for colicin V production
MSISPLDIIVAVVVLISAILAMVRGFVREVLSVASWVVAAGAAYYFYKPLVPLVQPYVESSTVATIVAAAAIFFVALIIASYITMKISDFVIDSRIGAFDRILGFCFGAARGVLLVVIALLFFDWLVQKPPSWIATAQTKPVLDNLGEKLMAALPEDFEASVMKRFRHQEGGAGGETAAPSESGEQPPADTEEDNPDNEAAPDESGTDDQGATLDPKQQRNMDQLIENSGSAN